MNNQFVLDQSFCCSGFQNLVADAGQRGIAALVVDTLEGITFRLQSRGVAFEDEGKFTPMPDAPDIKINIACETGLQFCPFCGRRLQELVVANPRRFAELAQDHLRLKTLDI